MSACFRLACVQVNVKNELVAIFEVTSELIENAVDLEAQFILLPECVALFEPHADALRRKLAPEGLLFARMRASTLGMIKSTRSMLIWGMMVFIANLIPIDRKILLLPRIFPGDSLG